MPLSFAHHGVAAAIGIDGVFGNEVDVFLVEKLHLGRQAKYRQAVDTLVRPKAPLRPEGKEDEDCAEENEAFFQINLRFPIRYVPKRRQLTKSL